jgi:hypothetical protein
MLPKHTENRQSRFGVLGPELPDSEAVLKATHAHETIFILSLLMTD